MRRLQAKLKMLPLWALSLLRCLQDTACQVLALGAPVEAVLATRGTQSHGPWPEPAAAASTASEGVFLAKVLGFLGCGLYLELH